MASLINLESGSGYEEENKIGYGPKKIYSKFISSLQPYFIAKIGKAFGLFCYFVDIRHRRIVRKNLKFIFPSWPNFLIKKTSKRIFQNTGISFFEIIQMRHFTREDVLKKIRIKGKENLYCASKSSSGAIFIGAHFGNWEMSQIYIECLLQTHFVIVARTVRPSHLNNWLNRLRSSFGSTIINKKGALPKLMRALRSGALVGLVIDQGTTFSEGVEIKFLGKTATATPSAAILARRFGSPILPVFCVREDDGILTVIVEAPLSLKKTDDRNADIIENTQLMNDAIERMIIAYPDQWFWFHKRWKRHYPDIYIGKTQ